MTPDRSTIIVGVLLAVLAPLTWAFNFIAPYVTGPYSIYDLTLIRFLIAGALGLVGVTLCRAQRRLVPRVRQWLAAGLGIIGYLGYSSCIAAGVISGGPVLTAAFVGLVPVLVALIGNARDRTVPWQRLALPLTLITLGLLLATISSMALPHAGQTDRWAGLFFSVLAVALWLAFSVLNQSALEQLPAAATGLWTALMMAGAGLGALCLIPVVQALGLLDLAGKGFGLGMAGPLYAWALVIALMSSVIGAWAWNAATQRLPMALSGQLISLEAVFAAVLGLVFHARLPTLMEAAGLVAVLMGAALAVRRMLSARRVAAMPA